MTSIISHHFLCSTRSVAMAPIALGNFIEALIVSWISTSTSTQFDTLEWTMNHIARCCKTLFGAVCRMILFLQDFHVAKLNRGIYLSKFCSLCEMWNYRSFWSIHFWKKNSAPGLVWELAKSRVRDRTTLRKHKAPPGRIVHPSRFVKGSQWSYLAVLYE